MEFGALCFSSLKIPKGLFLLKLVLFGIGWIFPACKIGQINFGWPSWIFRAFKNCCGYFKCPFSFSFYFSNLLFNSFFFKSGQRAFLFLFFPPSQARPIGAFFFPAAHPLYTKAVRRGGSWPWDLIERPGKTAFPRRPPPSLTGGSGVDVDDDNVAWRGSPL